MVTENMSGMMDLCTRESGTKTKSTAEAFMFGQMAENIMANGKIITCMVKVSILGKMAEDMKVNTKMIASTGMVSTPGTTANSTKAGGKTASNMVKEPTVKMVAID